MTNKIKIRIDFTQKRREEQNLFKSTSGILNFGHGLKNWVFVFAIIKSIITKPQDPRIFTNGSLNLSIIFIPLVSNCRLRLE